MAHSQEQQDAGGSRAHPQGYLMRLHQLSREHDAAAVKAAAQDRSGHHQQLQQQQQQVAAAQQPAMQESVPRRVRGRGLWLAAIALALSTLKPTHTCSLCRRTPRQEEMRSTLPPG
jgi:hypothetical protein